MEVTTLDPLLKPLHNEDAVKDPDEDNPEWDVWQESDCGRSEYTLTLGPGQHVVSFGRWQGRPCRSLCVALVVRRVGSVHETHIRAIGFGGFGGGAVWPGVEYEGVFVLPPP